MKLTDQQERFCIEYLKDLNGTQAAIRAGYSKKTANEQAPRLMSNKKILNHIAYLKAERNDRIQADADYVLQRLIEIDKLNIADILDDNGDLLPVNQWPDEWKRSVQSLDVHVKAGDDVEVYIKKIRIPDKLKNLELLGKHVCVSAFKEKLEISGSNENPLIIHVQSEETKNGLETLKNNLLK